MTKKLTALLLALVLCLSMAGTALADGAAAPSARIDYTSGTTEIKVILSGLTIGESYGGTLFYSRNNGKSWIDIYQLQGTADATEKTETITISKESVKEDLTDDTMKDRIRLRYTEAGGDYTAFWPEAEKFAVTVNYTPTTEGFAPAPTAQVGTGTAAASIEAAEGDEVKLNAPAVDGYRFVKWSTETEGVTLTNDTSATEASFTMVNKAVAVTAEYVKTWNVTYDVNGATGTAPVDDKSPYDDKASVTVLDKTDSMKKTGFEFTGWNTKADGTGTDYAANAKFNVAEDTILYAVWESTSTVESVTVKTAPTASTEEGGPIDLTGLVLSVKYEGQDEPVEVAYPNAGITVNPTTAPMLADGQTSGTTKVKVSFGGQDVDVEVNLKAVVKYNVTFTVRDTASALLTGVRVVVTDNNGKSWNGTTTDGVYKIQLPGGTGRTYRYTATLSGYRMNAAGNSFTLTADKDVAITMSKVTTPTTPTTPTTQKTPTYVSGGGSTGVAGVNNNAAGGSTSTPTTPTPSTAPTGDTNANGGVGGFSDVKSGDYFAAPVLWALNNNVTNGVGDGKFGPEAPCTRAQMVTFLWRAAGSPAAEATSAFKDVAADAYYAKAVAWAVANGITNGKGAADVFAPDDLMTRAEAVTFLSRARNGSGSANAGFNDVPGSAWFAGAVAWAVENGITNGMGNNEFQPNTNVNRAMSVTFLYRAYGNK